VSFLFSSATVPTWWTQHPASYPVLTGWFAGPKADTVARLAEGELVDMGLASLAEIFKLSKDRITKDLVTSQAINWGNDPFARGAYSYATPKTRKAQAALCSLDGGAVFFSGEALYSGRDMGTVEAALASGDGAVVTTCGNPSATLVDRGHDRAETNRGTLLAAL
jgi:monoamine oxidase